jgi:hypothetical protein
MVAPRQVVALLLESLRCRLQNLSVTFVDESVSPRQKEGPVGIENELRSTERVRDRRPGSVLESEEAEQALDARPHRLPIACSFPNR